MEASDAFKKISVGSIQEDTEVMCRKLVNISNKMRIVDGFVLRDVMGQATVIGEGIAQLNFNRLVTLNGTAAFLWRAVEGKEFDEARVAELLVEEYGIDTDLAEKDAASIVSQWKEIGLVK